MTDASPADPLDGLNARQRQAVTYGVSAAALPGPLLIIAGAGTGKTTTLAHRVAHLLLAGADPERVLLLTFTRRAALEMTRRAQQMVARIHGPGARPLPWAGTFHSIANRLLRLHAAAIGLDPAFTVLDRSDAEDVIDLVRSELGFDRVARRFPKKGTLVAIYSRVVNSGERLERVLDDHYDWCSSWDAELKAVFRRFVEAKQQRNLLDYDDLLLYWAELVSDPGLAQQVGARFDHLLVDEYQDTNALQARILLAMKPSGSGLTVVGDDAQSIYGFRAAEVRNIVEFPDRFEPPAEVTSLEENYRSTQPILDAANGVINLGGRRFTKRLFSSRRGGARPRLVTVEDEQLQAEHVADQVLETRETGVLLREQAVLFRAAHHSDALEVELARREIPFVKYGGLKFLEAAHVKDVMAVLRWAENPRDTIAAFRVLQLLEGVGPATARKAIERFDRGEGLDSFGPPAAAAESWRNLRATWDSLRSRTEWPGQVGLVLRWYEPELERCYDNAGVRLGDLEQLEMIAAGFPSRERFLTELTLDPPSVLGDEAGEAAVDEDWLILSTIHSAKGQEWEAVYVLNVVDGCIPSDLAAGSKQEIEEERRLLYVAMTRAKSALSLIQPRRFYVRGQSRTGDRAITAPASRFLPPEVQELFDREAHGHERPDDDGPATTGRQRIDAGARIKGMWD